MRYFVFAQSWIVFLINFQIIDSVILTPCKVQNMVTQPKYGTSLKTRSTVNIVQIPPVFVQNVMIGRCENQNQNYTTGASGEFYNCQQRYSAVEVYITEHALPESGNNQNNAYQASGYNDIKYIRESVIIESGCDFIFNLLPLLPNMKKQMENNQANPVGSEQLNYLRSPFSNPMPVVRQPTGTPPGGVPIAVQRFENSQPTPSQHPHNPMQNLIARARGSSDSSDENDNSNADENDSSNNQDSSSKFGQFQQPPFVLF